MALPTFLLAKGKQLSFSVADGSSRIDSSYLDAHVGISGGVFRSHDLV